jgi:helicase
MTNTADAIAYINSLAQNPGFLTEAAQIQAKALLSEVAEAMPPIKWSYVYQRIIRNIVNGTDQLEIISRNDPDQLELISSAAREFALIWEALAQLEEGTDKQTALLNAAVNYELAGYQANAICISKQLLQNNLYIPEPSVTSMSALFLQRRFLQLITVCRDAQIEPKNIDPDLTLVSSIGVGLTAKAFSQILKFFLRGEKDHIEEAMQIFFYAEQVYASIYLVPESNILRSIRSLLPIMTRRATWTVLADEVYTHPKWERYLKLLARGVSSAIYYGRSISELWPSQIAALKGGLLSSKSNKIVRMPTSAGKTRVAELAIVNTLIQNPDSKCVYVAPYRALVSEVEQSFLGLLTDLGFRVASVTGSFESDEFEELLFNETDLLVLTPEKLNLLRRAHPEFLERVKLFILDEGHIVHERSRGIKAEFLLTSLKRRLSNSQFIFISAVMSQETLESFAKWFNAGSEDILTSNWRPSIQRYAKFEWLRLAGVLRYAPGKDNPLPNEFVPGVIHQHNFAYRNPQTGRINHKKFPDTTNKSQVAAELALKFVEIGPVLIFCAQPSFVEAVAKALKERLNLISLSNQDYPQAFNKRDGTRSQQLASEWLGDGLVTSMLETGIGLHYGSLPDAVRNAVETDFRQKKFQVLIATNTLAQGVNLPIRTVIVHSCNRYIDGEIERISARDYWNIAGRAGRAGEETEGLVIHIINSERDEEDFKYYLAHREEVETTHSATFQRLDDLIRGRLSEEVLKTDLDPEVLAMLVEEGADAESKHIVKDLEESLVYSEAINHPILVNTLKRVFTNIADEIIQRVPDPDFRGIYSATGLSSISCELIRKHIASNEVGIGNLLESGEQGQIDEIVDMLLPVCLTLPEMQPERHFGGSYSELLKQWIKGTEILTLINEFGSLASSTDDLGRFIDDLFRYRLPWGISAYIKISSKILDIDRQTLPDFIKYFSSMVKFGLPDYPACWAMTTGIPSRQVAINLAAAFRDEAPTPLKYQDFIAWLSSMNIERLRMDFGLSGPILEDVSRSMFLASMNPLLRGFTTISDFLPRETMIRGISYGNRKIAALSAQVGQPINLIRDYENYLDRNAISAILSGKEVGYLPREIAQVLAPEIDVGTIMNAKITEIKKNGIPEIKIQITV